MRWRICRAWRWTSGAPSDTPSNAWAPDCGPCSSQHLEGSRQGAHPSSQHAFNPLWCKYFFVLPRRSPRGGSFKHILPNPLKDVLNELILAGGDADTNGAVAGALLGCRLGFSQLPQDRDMWVAVEVLKECCQGFSIPWCPGATLSTIHVHKGQATTQFGATQQFSVSVRPQMDQHVISVGFLQSNLPRTGLQACRTAHGWRRMSRKSFSCSDCAGMRRLPPIALAPPCPSLDCTVARQELEKRETGALCVTDVTAHLHQP